MDLSFIIAVKGECKQLENLLETINDQYYANISTETIIVDGGCKNLERRIQSYKNINSQIIPSDDFSIYDALNTGVKSANGDYYVVAGQDDIFDKNFLNKIEDTISSKKYDLIVGDIIKRGERISSDSDRFPRFSLMEGIASSHSVGSVIKRALHEEIGFYSNKYPVCADQLFLINASNFKKVHSGKVFGECAATGFSDNNSLQSLCEQFLIQVEELDKAKVWSLTSMVVRISKYWLK